MKKILFFLILASLSFVSYSQVQYVRKVEAGYLHYLDRVTGDESGSDWKGYNLNEKQNGYAGNFILGVRMNQTIFAGIGAGYMDFEGTEGASFFGDFEYIFYESGISPLINAKIGYSHIWNQYEDGKGSLLFEIGPAIKFAIEGRTQVILQTGICFTQQALFVPLKIGLTF